jgi:hypothetical protein
MLIFVVWSFFYMFTFVESKDEKISTFESILKYLFIMK